MWDKTSMQSIKDSGGRKRQHMRFICDDCGIEEFKRYIKTTKYCHNCVSKHISIAIKKRPKPVAIIKQCLQCNKDYEDTTNHKQQKYCCERCMDMANLKNPIFIVKQCLYCQVDFKDITYGKNRKFCTSKCSRRYLPNRLKHNLRSRINHAIKSNFKTGSAIDDLGCSIEFLKKYLENQFTHGMSWDNYGKTGWSIDHIKPLDSFDLTDRAQYLIASNYKNLQPLWATENSKKRNKI